MDNSLIFEPATGRAAAAGDRLRLKLLAGAAAVFVIIAGYNVFFTAAVFAKLYATGNATPGGGGWPFTAGAVLAGALLLTLWLNSTVSAADSSRPPRKKIALVVLSILGAIQLVLFIRLAHAFDITVLDLDQAEVTERLLGAALDVATAMAASVLCTIELLILVFSWLERSTVPVAARMTPALQYGAVRPAIFLFLFGIDFSVAFLPLHMERMYEPLFGLSKDVVMGLPISAEFLCVGVAILAAGFWIDRRGWYEPFMTGLVMATAGAFYSWLAPDAVHFILSRVVLGLGYGFTLMASQGFVIAHTDDSGKAKGLAYLFAGVYAGSISGTTVGAMLAEYTSYQTVFLIGALILLAAAAYALYFFAPAAGGPAAGGPDAGGPDAAPPGRAAGSETAARRLINFLSDRTALSLILLSSLPAAIAVIGFLNYFAPIYLHRNGVSEAAIGRVLIVYGVCMVYIAPFVGRFIDASPNKKAFIFIGSVLGACSLLIFWVAEGLFAITAAVFLLGLSSSFVLSAQSAYLLKLKVAEDLGAGKAIAVFRSTSRVGQMLGPVVFSIAVLTVDIAQGVVYLGLIYLLAAVCFLLFTVNNGAAHSAAQTR